MDVLRHVLALALVRLAPIRDQLRWFIGGLVFTALVGGSVPALLEGMGPQLPGRVSAWIPGDPPGLGQEAWSVDHTPLRGGPEDFVVGMGAPAWTGLPEESSERTFVWVEPDARGASLRPRLVVRGRAGESGDPEAGSGEMIEVRPGFYITGEETGQVAEARAHLRAERSRADAAARATLGVTADPRESVAVTFVDVPRRSGSGPPTPDGLGGLLLGVGLVHGLGLLAAGLPRWRSRGFFLALRVAPVPARAVLLGGLLAAVVGGVLASGMAVLGWGLHALRTGTPLPLAPHHALVPLAMVPALALAQRVFLTAADTRAAGFRVIGIQVGLGFLGALWFLAVGHAGLLGGAAVPFVGLGALASGMAPVQAGSLAVAVASALSTTVAVVGWSAHTLARDPVESGDPTLRRRSQGRFLPEAVLLLLIAVGGTTTFTLPLQRWGTGPALLVGQLGFLLAPSLVLSLVLAIPARQLLVLRRPRRQAWALVPVVALGGVALSLLLGHLAVRLADPDDIAGIRVLGQQLAALADGPGVLLLTVLPAVCEELLFRGAIFRLLRARWSAWAVVLAQAFAFALLHGMVLRVAPTLGLGLLLGVLRLRTGSVWPGVAVHALHNAVLLGLGFLAIDPTAGSEVLSLAALGLVAAAGCAAAWRSGPGLD